MRVFIRRFREQQEEVDCFYLGVLFGFFKDSAADDH